MCLSTRAVGAESDDVSGCAITDYGIIDGSVVTEG